MLECKLAYTPDYVPLTYCLSECWSPCPVFSDYSYLKDSSYKDDVLFLMELYHSLEGKSYKNKLKRFKAYTNYRNARVRK